MKFSWGHGVIVALATFILFILGMVFYFTSTMKNSELVSDNYYEEELQYQNVIDAKNRADQLTQKPSVKLLDSGIQILFPENDQHQNSKFNFFLFRTDDKNLDIKKDFVLDANNQYIIPKNILRKGSYTLKLKWKNNKLDYQIDYNILWK